MRRSAQTATAGRIVGFVPPAVYRLTPMHARRLRGGGQAGCAISVFGLIHADSNPRVSGE